MREYLSSFGAGMGALPEIAGSCEGRNVIICADAACIWDDLEAFGCRWGNGVAKGGWDFMTVNRAVETFPGRVEHAFSNNAGTLQKFCAARRDEYADMPVMNTHALTQGCDHVWPFSGHGTSGLGACLVAIGLGYSRVVLCGMPLDDGPHNGEPHWHRTAFQSSEASVDDWARARDLAFEGRVRSMSGRTLDWLGDARALA